MASGVLNYEVGLRKGKPQRVSQNLYGDIDQISTSAKSAINSYREAIAREP